MSRRLIINDDQKLLSEAIRRLKANNIVDSLGLFKEYIERMKQKRPDFDLKQILDVVCLYAIKLQEQTESSDLSIMMLLWAEEQAKHQQETKKIIQTYLSQAYRRAGQYTLTPKNPVLFKNKSDTTLKSFYFRSKPIESSRSELPQQAQESSQIQKSTPILKKPKEFQIKKQKKKLDWSSDEDDQEERKLPQGNPKLENLQREQRIKFLQSQIDYQLEARVTSEEKPKEYNIFKIIKVQAYIRMKQQMKKYKKLLAHRKKQERLKQQSYDQTIKFIQRWIKWTLMRIKFKKLWFLLAQQKVLTRYPKKILLAAIKIQQFIRRHVQMQCKPQIKQRLRSKIIEMGKNKIFNKLFVINVNFSDKFTLTYNPRFKKMCARQFQKEYICTMSANEFIYKIRRVDEYLDYFNSLLEPNLIVLEIFKQIGQMIMSIRDWSPKNPYLIKQLSKIKFENLIYFRNEELHIYGFTDFKYSDIFISTQQQFQSQQLEFSKKKNPFDIDITLRLILRLQSLRRAVIEKRLADMKKHRRTTVIRQFCVCKEGMYAQISINKDQMIYARILNSKKMTQPVLINDLITKQIGYPTRDNFTEIYKIVDGQLQYTEEAEYWNQKSKDQGKEKKKIPMSVVYAASVKIQTMVRFHQAARQKEIYAKQNQLQMKRSQASAKINLVRKVSIQNQRAYFLNFSIQTKDEKVQTIQIDVKPLEHSLNKDTNIIPYKQPLFYEIDFGDIIEIGRKMLDIGEVKLNRDQLKFEVSNVMEVQGMLMSQPNLNTEKTLEARRILNRHYRDLWVQPQSYPIADVAEKKEGNTNEILCMQRIARKYKFYRKDYQTLLRRDKNVVSYDQDSIKEYLMGIKLESDYGFGGTDEGKFNVHFLEQMEEKLAKQKAEKERIKKEQQEEEQRRKQEDLERERELRLNSFKFYHNYCVISGQRISLQIIYNKIQNQLFLKGSNEGDVEYDLSIDIKQLMPGDVIVEFLKEEIENIVLKQLIIHHTDLIFQPDMYIQQQMLMEQMIWDQHRNKPIDLVNLVGPLYGLDLVFKYLNKNKTMLENLVDNKKAAFLIKNCYHYRTTHEYVLNLTDAQFITTIYYENDFRTHIVPIKLLNCYYLSFSMKSEPPEVIIKLLLPFVNAVDDLLEVDFHAQTSNFDKFRDFLPNIFFDQYSSVMRKRIMMRQTFSFYSIYKQKKEMFIHQSCWNIEGRYIQILFFLLNYDLKVVFKKLNDLDGNGNVVENKEKKVYFINLLEQDLGSDFRVSADKWLDIQTKRQLNYYRQTYKPLVEYIMNNLVIDTEFQITFKKIIAKERLPPQQSLQTNTDYYTIIEAVVRLQSRYKAFKQREIFTIKFDKYQSTLSQARQIGKLVFRTYRKYQDNHYIVMVFKYKKQVDYLTVDLLDIKYKKKKNFRNYKIRGIYIKTQTSMTNAGNQSFYNYLLDIIYIEENEVKFKEAHYDEPKQQVLNDQSEIFLQPQSNYFEELQEEDKDQPLEVQQKYQQSIINDQDQLIASKSPIISNIQEKYHQSDLIFSIQKSQNEEIPETIYNIVYSGPEQMILESKHDNTIQLSVNLCDIKKLYPNLNTYDGNVMQLLSDQIVDGIKVDRNGKLLIDQQKINPSLVNINTRENLTIETIQKREKNLSSITLMKKTTYFDKQKFLLTVNVIEKKVNQILGRDQDSVFNHFEVVYQLQATSLQQNIEPLIWELSQQEAIMLTNEQNQRMIAQQLIKRTLLVDRKFVYLAQSKEQVMFLRFPNVILFEEKGIKPIQNRFKNRHRIRNFLHYKKTMKQWRDMKGKLYPNVIMALDTLSSEMQFIYVAGEDRNKRVILLAWDLQTFQQYEIELPKNKYQTKWTMNKLECLKFLISGVQFKVDQLIFEEPKQVDIKKKTMVRSKQITQQSQ